MVCRGDGVLGYFVAYGPSAYNAPHDTAQVIGGVAASIAIAFGIIAFLRAVGTPRARARAVPLAWWGGALTETRPRRSDGSNPRLAQARRPSTP